MIFEDVALHWALGGDQLQFIKSLLSIYLSVGPVIGSSAIPIESHNVSVFGYGTKTTRDSILYQENANPGSTAAGGATYQLPVSKMEGSAFLTTDSRMNMVWMNSESRGAVEEVTVLSLSKMSMLPTADKPSSSKKLVFS